MSFGFDPLIFKPNSTLIQRTKKFGGAVVRVYIIIHPTGSIRWSLKTEIRFVNKSWSGRQIPDPAICDSLVIELKTFMTKFAGSRVLDFPSMKVINVLVMRVSRKILLTKNSDSMK